MIISIIIPVYNVEEYVGRNLDSIINQTCGDFELIVVNDGSTDNSLNIINEKLNSSLVKNFQIISKRNGGVSSARNEGIRRATGDFILFLDGDDYLSDNFVESIVQKATKQSDTEVICFGYDLVKVNDEIIFRYFERNTLPEESISGIDLIELKLNKKIDISMINAVYKRDLILSNSVYFNENSVNGEDQEFILKLVSNARKITFLNEVLSYYVKRPTSISNNFSFNKFDSVYSLVRSFDYLRHRQNNDFEDLCNKFESDFILKNFLGNINEFVRYNSPIGLFSIQKLNQQFNNALLEYYPDLNCIVKRIIMKNSFNSLSVRGFIAIKKPYLYILLFKLYQSCLLIKKKVLYYQK